MPTELLSPEYGLSNSKLEECTATEADVLSGKTFYSGSTEIKTGTGKMVVYVGAFGGHHDANVRNATFDMKKSSKWLSKFSIFKFSCIESHSICR